MFENDIRFKEAISHFGEKASYQWLSLNGDEWIEQSNKTIDLDFLSDLKKGNIRNIKYQVSSPKSGNKTKCLIDISELRIGNFVKIKTSNDAAYYPIYAIDGMGLKVVLGGVRQCEGWDAKNYINELKSLIDDLYQKTIKKKKRSVDTMYGLELKFEN